MHANDRLNNARGGMSHGRPSRFGVLELLLMLAVIALIGELCWPAMIRWWYRPIAGSIGVDVLDHGRSKAPVLTSLADEYLLYLPDGYSGRRRRWPLVVFLHGAGERGLDTSRVRYGPFAAIMKGVNISAIVAAPQCRANCDWEPKVVADFINGVQSKYSVDSSTVYLVGYSMGGYATWNTAEAFPDLFAAIVPISSGGRIARATALNLMPIWAFHGEKDTVIPLLASERIVDAVNADGGHAKLTVLPDAGHAICNDVCNRTDLWKWLFQQRRIDGQHGAQPEDANP